MAATDLRAGSEKERIVVEKYLQFLNGAAIKVGTTVDLTALWKNGITVPTAKSLIITDADALTVAGVIVPQFVYLAVPLLLNTAAVDQNIFYATRALQVASFHESHGTAGTDASAVTLNLEKLTGTTAAGSGVQLLTDNANAGVSLKSTANTPQAGTLTGTVGSLQLAAGDRLGLNFTGVLTAYAGGLVLVRLKAI